MSAPVTMIGIDFLVSLARARKAPVCTHSGKADSGCIFVSLPKAAPVGPEGPDFTGAGAFLLDAVRAGAAFVVCTQAVFEDAGRLEGVATTAPVSAAIVPDTRVALGELAKAWHGTEYSKIKLYAVTGTNGKTTSTYLLEAVLRGAGRVPGVLGTIAYRWPGYEEASPLTTPDCMTLHGMLAAMEKAGADTALMEVSSHSIEQNRIAGLSFAGALFTNLTQDHLDYHRNMEEYFEAKARLFRRPEQGGLARPGAALAVNVDDFHGSRLAAANPDVLGYSLERRGIGILTGTILEQGRDGLHLRMQHQGDSWELFSPLVGAFNAANLLGAQALGLKMGLPKEAFQVLASFSGVPGRLERIPNPQGLSVFVDYAHTPDALEKALQALRGAGFSRIVTVFGCGGNRDRTKRPLMGAAAAAFSDVTVVTSDNSRRENPALILADIRPGLAKAREVVEEIDRRKAIGMALDILRPGDALLIAGKGHESYQIVGDTKYPFSDQQVVREHLGCE